MTVNEETRRLMSLDMARYYYEEVNRRNEGVHRGILRWYRACVLFFVAGTALASIVAAAVAVL